MTTYPSYASSGDGPHGVSQGAAQTPAPAPSAAPVPGAADTVTREELDKLPLQALLVRLGRLTMDQLADVLHENVRTGRPVEEIVVAHGWVSQEEIALLTAMKQAGTAPAAPAPPEAPAPAPSPDSPAPRLSAVADEPLILDSEPVAERPEPAQVVSIVEPERIDPPLSQHVDPEPRDEAPEPEAAAPPAPDRGVAQDSEEPAPAAAAEAAEAPAPAPADTIAIVVLHLENGNRIWSSWFPTVAEAQARAQEYADAVVSPDPARWPTIGGWTIRPETVVAVEVTVQLRGA